MTLGLLGSVSRAHTTSIFGSGVAWVHYKHLQLLVIPQIH